MYKSILKPIFIPALILFSNLDTIYPKKIVLDFFIRLYGYSFRKHVAVCSNLWVLDEKVKPGIGLDSIIIKSHIITETN